MNYSFWLILAILAAIVFVFFYLTTQPVHAPEYLDDATKADRCAEFREVDLEDDNVYSLGYGGRIRQLLHGCF